MAPQQDPDALQAVLDELRSREDCVLLEPAGQPMLPGGLALPEDLALFYETCGGARLFTNELAWRVWGPGELVPAAPRLLTGQIAEELCAREPEHVASTCFVFADNGGGSTGEHVVVDLHPSRLGRF